MRPGIGVENAEPRPRKSSVAESPNVAGDRYSAPPPPTTFFLAREPEIPKWSPDRGAGGPPGANSPVSSLQETLQEADRPSKSSAPRIGAADGRSNSRRRSTIRPLSGDRLRRRSSTASVEQAVQIPERPITPALLPSPLPSHDVSPPSSPKSISSRSMQKSDDGLTSDETGSQAIASSEDEDERDQEISGVVQDSQPELIMPSIKMPSRRPFTQRGKRLGKFKVLVAGRKGVGKTSLIKSIVQVCEDIVHVDPLSSNPSSITASARHSHGTSDPINEIYASTKPYPAWWSNVDESRILRRRKSMGDSVLERNVCFVDTSDSCKLENIIHYVEQQLVHAISSANAINHEFTGLLSGRGGSQVDLILYLVSHGHWKDDCDRIRQLSELSNIVPLIAKSDLLSAEEHQEIKQTLDATYVAFPRLPASLSPESDLQTIATAPYTVTSTNGPDTDNMDASVLMSSEYVQPLLPSELSLLIEQIFDPDTVAFLRHSSSQKLVAWHATHPRLTRVPSPSLPSVQNSTLASPLPTSLSNSGVLIPIASEVSLNTSNSYALAKVADHTQREERLAQVRLSKWASELQLSLQRERERYERLARGERALWLVERMGEEVRDGQIVRLDTSQALVRTGQKGGLPYGNVPTYHMHDPLGLLRWKDTMRTRGWIALQVIGSFGVVGGLAFWLAKTCGLTAAINDWAQSWTWFGMHE